MDKYKGFKTRISLGRGEGIENPLIENSNSAFAPCTSVDNRMIFLCSEVVFN